MKLLLGAAALFMLPSAVVVPSSTNSVQPTLVDAESNVAYSPEAQHDSDYYSIDLIVDDSLSYSVGNVFFVCRVTGFSSEVDFSIDGNDYYLNHCPILDDGSSFRIYLTARRVFEECTTVLYARQYDDKSHSYITRSETFYSAWRDNHISLSTHSLEHAHDCADLAYHRRVGTDQNLSREFSAEWDAKNNARNSSFVSSNVTSWNNINTYRFYLRNGRYFEPLKYVNVGVYLSNSSNDCADYVYLTDEYGEVTLPWSASVRFLRVMSCSVDNYYVDVDPDDPRTTPLKNINYAYKPSWPDNAYDASPHGIALYRAKNFIGELAYYYNDFYVNGNVATDFYIDVTNSSGQTSSFGKAMQVIQTLAYGKRYAERFSGMSVGKNEIYRAFYPCSGKRSYHKNTVEFNNVKNNMYISEDAGSCPDVVLHELGHCFQQRFNLGESFGLPHYVGANNFAQFDNDIDRFRFAWSEAFPSVFAILVANEYGEYFSLDGNWPDTSFDSHDCSFDLESTDLKLGQYGEEDVAAILYDIFDPYDSSEPFDRLSFGHDDFWDFLLTGAFESGTKIDTFGSFFNYFKATRSSVEIERLQDIMREYGFSPDPSSDGNGTITGGPMLSWAPINGAYRYDVVLYDGYGSKITTRYSRFNYYGIDDYDWDSILRSPTSSWYYEIVAYTSLNDGDSTYSSGLILMSKPSGTVDGGNITIDNTPSNRVVIKNIELKTETTIRYTFRTTSSGYTTFQTVGPYGSIIKLYDSNNNLIASDEGGMYGEGYGSERQRNGFIRCYCAANKDYVLTVKDCNNGRNYYGTLIVMQAKAYTKGSLNYDTAYSLQELVSNDGYYQVDCVQRKTSIFNYVPLSGTGTFTAELTSNLDTYLYVIDALNGYVYEDDDSGDGLNAKVTFNGSSGLKYLIMVTQYNPSNNPSTNKAVTVHIKKV